MSALKGESQRGVKGFARVVNTENKTPKTDYGVRLFKVKKYKLFLQRWLHPLAQLVADEI